MRRADGTSGMVDDWLVQIPARQSSTLPIFRRAAAFTLLEVVLAVTILGLVIGAITATWQAGLNGWKRSAGISE